MKNYGNSVWKETNKIPIRDEVVYGEQYKLKEKFFSASCYAYI